jgi:hypothetical protein
MKVTREFRGRLLVAYCDSDLAEQASSLLRMIEEADEHVGGLRDGTVIEFGWAPLRLRAENEGLVVCEPDYAGDVNQFVPSASRTWRVVAEQTALLNTLGVEGVPAKYDQGVVLKRGVLALRRIYLHRREPVSDRDSGWYIGPADNIGEPPDPSQLDAIHVYRLLNLRPALPRVMALPPEYIVVFDGDEIEAVVDPSNRRVWPVSPESTPPTESRRCRTVGPAG